VLGLLGASLELLGVLGSLGSLEELESVDEELCSKISSTLEQENVNAVAMKIAVSKESLTLFIMNLFVLIVLIVFLL
jgi:hypothetical protein